jgi:hypothetical protein
MDKSRLLWILVAADVLLAFGSVGAQGFFSWTLPATLEEFNASNGTSPFQLVLLGITTVSAFAAWIGLVSFWRRARELYVVASACGIVLLLFSGPQVMPSVAAAFGALNGLASGAILGLVYFSDLARRFERRPVVQAVPHHALS